MDVDKSGPGLFLNNNEYPLSVEVKPKSMNEQKSSELTPKLKRLFRKESYIHASLVLQSLELPKRKFRNRGILRQKCLRGPAVSTYSIMAERSKYDVINRPLSSWRISEIRDLKSAQKLVKQEELE